MGDPNPTALVVVDTDVLVDYLCDQADAVAFLEGCAQPLALSVVSVAGFIGSYQEQLSVLISQEITRLEQELLTMPPEDPSQGSKFRPDRTLIDSSQTEAALPNPPV